MNRRGAILLVVLFAHAAVLFAQELGVLEEAKAEYQRYFSNIGFTAGKLIINNGFLPLLDEGLHDTELAVLSKEELRLVRNTIYARRGYIFQSAGLTAHFSRFDWYRPEFRAVDDKLNALDRENIRRIQAFENARPDPALKKSGLVGEWHGIPVAAGDYNTVTIRADNSVEFGYNTMYPKAALSCRGTYKIEGGYLIALITEQRVFTGEYFHKGAASTLGGMDGEGRSAVLRFDKPVRMVFPISALKDTYEGAPVGGAIVRQIGSADRVR